jgi:hypothetical protein
MSCEYVRENYGVPACIGRRVVCYGKPGVIVEDRGNYIGVTLDEQKPGTVSNYHPTDGIIYGEMGRIRKMTPSQARYKRYLDVSECFDDFLHFLRYDAARARGEI